MPIITFGRAVRRGTHVIVTAYGESGCGKTYSLIKLGRGLVGPKGKLGMIDTETGRGLIYANVGGGYEYAELTAPFAPERYTEAIDAAEAAGIEALIIDSGSHEWEGLGGVLEIADGEALRGLAKWARPKARHKKYVQRLLNSRMHLLISLRAKEKMLQLTDKTPIPAGMKIGDIISAGYVPIQDKRFVFETTVQLFLPVYADRAKLGMPLVEKCPEDLLGAFPAGAHISEETGRKIAEWVSGGVPVDQEFESLRRDAEEAAGGGTEPLRTHWRGLSKAARERLAAHVDNLGSIARVADQDQEERKREREQPHRAFRPVGDEGADEPTPQPEEDAFGLPPLNTARGNDAPERSPAGEVAQHDGASPGGPAPAGEREFAAGEDSANEPRDPHPPRQGEHHSASADRVGPLERGDRRASAEVAQRGVERGIDAPPPQRADLLGDAPAENLTVPLAPRPTEGEFDYFARQLLYIIAERPRDKQRLARIKLANEGSIRALGAAGRDGYSQVMRALGGGNAA